MPRAPDRHRDRRRALPAGGPVSLRWQIALTITAVSCVVAAVLGVLVHNVVARQTVGEVRKEVRQELDAALSAYEYGTSTSGDRIALDPRELPGPLRELVAEGEQGSMVGSRRGQPVMWAAAPADGRPLAVWSPYRDTRDRLAAIDTAILGSALLAAGAVTLAGIFLATGISRRLSSTAQVARRITEGDLDARVGMTPGRGGRGGRDRKGGRERGRDGRAGKGGRGGRDGKGGRGERGGKGGRGGRDEVRDVAGALDSMAASLQSRLETEKRFTADVAHELRTPLTGMVAAAGLLPEGRPKEMINDRLQALRSLTEDLLEISRLDAGAEHADLAPCALGPLVERAVRATGLEAEVRVVRDTVVETDRRRLDRILANLITNAHRHGRPPVVVTVDGPVIEVLDHGAGYPAELIEQGPQRFRTGDPGRGRGHGLGLTIALGQAQVLGVGVEFTHGPEGGARTVLRLPSG
ncbi:HAMP domain-containing sensor histidine kinase [Streptomyces sp. LHD-70]|uniref:sensor histidine kinase n=1 Tax=Streptomyces sp. LHD-70 TaxID=3072140 RepID=UPI00280C4E8E|nr:HAMP domain-containing sensor histidine kinase [Streptomyces sp. LHD-70]MDQ8707617.1 HAMP domain-containing sensor histidine kinase [Streptomyces sp. LHD-70]